MYPSRFRYAAPRTLDEAIALLAEHGDDAKVLAGGQSLVPLLKLRFAAPALLVDINNLPGLGHHREDGDGTLRVGALCRHADLERSTLLPGRHALMAAAAPLVADPIVRNRGTLVGSVCHADPQGDWAAVMIALGASVIAQGPAGRRSIPVAQFVLGPFQNALRAGEIAVEAVVPPAAGTATGSYLKLERRVGGRGGGPRAVGRHGHPRGHRPHRRRPRDDPRHLRRGRAGREAAHRGDRRARGQPRGGGRPAAQRPPRERGLQAARRGHVRAPRPGTRPGGGGMSGDVLPPAEAQS
jgi:FAD binding domain in molybdopterin dehydrogenase